ncbi:hypothetical protein A9Q84_04610 [Halobacteriovorax marinus]|uniref:Uncharacterized protein n=1 Tax=Halobacteriovorax marinus TaxID=97084 RepID=A0A1Y5FAI4_9BACT|nr:hypothetical protein A9Q84_04610 [Halobacteriovorax marinus]
MLTEEYLSEKNGFALDLDNRYSQRGELEETAKSLLENIENIKEESRSLVLRNKEAKSINVARELEVESIFEKYIEIDSTFQEVKSENEKLGLTCKSLDFKKRDFLSKRKILNESIFQKRRSIEEDKSKTKELSTFIDKIEIEIEDLSKERERADKSVRKQKEIVRIKDRKFSERQMQLSNLKELTKSSESERDELRSDVKQLDNENLHLKDSISEATSEVKKNRDEIESRNHEISRLKEKYNKYLSQKGKLLENKSYLNSDLDKLRENISEFHSDIKLVKEERDSLEVNLDRLREDVSRSEKELSRQELDQIAIKESLENLRSQRNDLSIEFESSNKTAISLSERKEFLLESRNHLKESIQKLEDNKSKVQLKNKCIKDELKHTESKNHKLSVERESLDLEILSNRKLLKCESERLEKLKLNTDKISRKNQEKIDSLSELDSKKEKVIESYQLEVTKLGTIIEKKAEIDQLIKDREQEIQSQEEVLKISRSTKDQTERRNNELRTELSLKDKEVHSNVLSLGEIEKKILTLQDIQHEIQLEIDRRTISLEEQSVKEAQVTKKLTQAYVDYSDTKKELEGQINLKRIKVEHIQKTVKLHQSILTKVKKDSEHLKSLNNEVLLSSKELKTKRLFIEKLSLKQRRVNEAISSIEKKKRFYLEKLSNTSKEILSEQDLLEEVSKKYFSEDEQLKKLEVKCSEFETNLVEVRLESEKKKNETKVFTEKQVVLNKRIRELSSKLNAVEINEATRGNDNSISATEIDKLEKEVSRLNQMLIKKKKQLKREAANSELIMNRSNELRAKKIKLVEHVKEVECLLNLESKSQIDMTNFNDQLEGEVSLVNKRLQSKKNDLSEIIDKKKVAQKKRFKRPSLDA